MKKLLSIVLTVAMIASLFVLNVSATVPTEPEAMWTKLLSEDFEGTQEFFKAKQGDSENVAVVAESEDSDNNVIDIKFGDKATNTKTDGTTYRAYDNVRIGQGSAKSDTLATGIELSDNYIIELDVCGRNLIGPLSISVRSAASASNYKAVNINPNTLEKDTWYTYRILVHATSTLDIHASTTTVMRKLRDGDEDFKVLTADTDYAISNTWANNAIGIGVIAMKSYCSPYIDGMDTTTEKMAPGNSTLYDGYTAILDTHYQLDNINLYSLEEASKGVWNELLSENYDGENATYFVGTGYGDNLGTGIVAESEESTNGVFDLKFGGRTNDVGIPYSNVRTGQGTAKTDNLTADITLTDDFILEFDACGKKLVGSLAVGFRDEVSANDWYGLYLDPNYMVEDEWYTYRIYTESTSDANSNTHVVMRKPRNSDEPFKVLRSGFEYTKIKASYVNQTMSFGILANKGISGPYINGMDETTITMTQGSSTFDGYQAILDSHYQLDNIKVIGKDAESYELNSGIYKKYDMEAADTSVTNATYLTKLVDDNNNTYIKYALPSTALDGQNHLIAINSTKDPATVGLPEKFIFSFDANNTKLGYEMTFEIYGDGDGVSEKLLPRYAFYLKSTEADKGIWYSYKVVATGTPGKDNVLDFEIYRKERDKDEAWKLLSGAYCVGREGDWPSAADYDYGEVHTLSYKGGNRNTIRFGDSKIRYVDAYKANETGNANIGGVWLFDNFEITDAAAVSGNAYATVTDAETGAKSVSAKLNISAATDCAPIVAIYDGDRFVGLGSAEADAEGTVTVTVDNYTEGNTVKLFVWDTVSAGTPLLGNVLDISSFL